MIHAIAGLGMSLVSLQAGAVLLDFEDGVGGASAATYYQASHGITFSGGGLLADGNSAGYPDQPRFVSYLPGLQIATMTKVTGDTYADSFFDIWVNFSTPVTNVSGDYISNLGSGATVSAYDGSGMELASIYFPAASGPTSTVGKLGTFDFGSLGGIRSLHLISDDAVTGSMLDNLSYSPVPVPAAVWLFGSGLVGLWGGARRKS